MKYCNKTKELINANYISLSVEEIVDLIQKKQLRPRTVESVTAYIAKINDSPVKEIKAVYANTNLEKYRAKTLYYGAKARAKTKGLSFDLTIEWIYERIKKGVCEATGAQFILKEYSENVLCGPYSPSIDQIIPSAGYTKSNCRIVVDFYNKMKNNRSDIETINFAKQIITNHVNKHCMVLN